MKFFNALNGLLSIIIKGEKVKENIKFLKFNKKDNLKILLNFLGNLFFFYCIVVSLALILFSSITIECEVNGSSMYPTLNNNYGSNKNDVVFVNIYDKDVTYGDIVVVQTSKEKIIKRVVGMSGDEIDIVKVNNEYLLERNGEIIKETYICQNINPSTPTLSQNGMDSTYLSFQGLKESNPLEFSLDGKYVVPKDSIFVLGDNRTVSQDSSYYGAFSIENLVGRVEYIKKFNESTLHFYYYYILEGKFFNTFFNMF